MSEKRFGKGAVQIVVRLSREEAATLDDLVKVLSESSAGRLSTRADVVRFAISGARRNVG